MDIIAELEWRGLVADCTDAEELGKRLASGPITLYVGFDPTADSLHVGNLVPLLALRRFQMAGHRPIALAGGATGLIGDPSGKSAERNLLSPDVLETNIAAVKQQLQGLLDFEAGELAARLLDNASWFAPITFLDFLRDTGKHFSVNAMVAKESVKNRMGGVGISFTEFSYMLLQAYDFYHLRQVHGCELQVGGSDQWGNITAGIDLIRRRDSVPAWGLTLPLLTNADGTKFGKTEAGAVWLDPKRTSVYRFYQFWINSDDRDVIQLLKYFTFLDRDALNALAQAHEENPGRREAHRALAEAVTTLIHGKEAMQDAVRASQILFGGDLEGISEELFGDVAGEVPTKDIPRADLDGEGIGLLDLLVTAGLCPSKGQARKDVQGGGIYVNNVRCDDFSASVGADRLLFGKHLLLRKGKKNYVVLTAR